MDPAYRVLDTAQSSHELVTLTNSRVSVNSNGHGFLDPPDQSETGRLNPDSLTSKQQARSDKSILTKTRYIFSKPFVEYQSRKRRSRFYGWQWGVVAGICGGIFVLLMNLTFVIIGLTSKSGYQEGIATLLSGGEDHISRANAALHVVVNILSTLLLSGSNYAMQVLSSPTRTECIKAHRKGHWLEIGILSLSNVSKISSRRRTLWLILGLSSIPLHLFYNASIFRVLSDNEYRGNIIQYNAPEWRSLDNATTWDSMTQISKLSMENIKTSYDRNSTSEFGHLSLSVVSINYEFSATTHELENSRNRSITLPSFQMPVEADDHNLRNWIAQVDSTGRVPAAALRKDWQSEGNAFGAIVTVNLEGGYALRGRRNCKIQMSLPFLMIVILCNAIKIICLILTIMKSNLDTELPLVTVGDAVAAFSEHPDVLTHGHCTYSVKEYLWKVGQIKQKQVDKQGYHAERLIRRREGVWETREVRYAYAITKWKRVVLVIVFSLAAWGSASTARFATGQRLDGSSTSRLAFVANSPQLVLSLIYLFYNNLFTSMALAYEWDRLGRERKSLRVTKPRGQQRETYFLQLPLKWGIPVNFASGLLHWLASQTLFLVRLDRYDNDGALKVESSEAACGFSLPALLALVIVLVVLFSLVCSLGYICFDTHIPFAGSCSWVIGAACHTNQEETTPWLEKVQWGVVSEEERAGETIGHCSFSARPVKAPKDGRKYA
ncbi:hypothetical protein P171DRAFT_477820 [Karstenula rhodostoma CBS 690.94]|uniref:DUF6536 domain-containing protein n=1 Tax=Karstenula rhodostoma CBS 690.94 TaxID=1392251 RepID=A0A9P4P5Y0_9PLEO|nr:hypothetical protein P171DRAFT_477820 [Karstenula rhodostoma CBS 690.94]